MKTFLGVAIAILAVCGLAVGQQSDYQAQASVKDIMAKMVGPNNGQLRGMRENGPQSDEDWAAARTAATIMAEAAQLLEMGGRSKDGVWSDASKGLTSATGALVAASDSKDVAAWKAAVGNAGQSCQSCHKVHRIR